jgi:hypothetical protein
MISSGRAGADVVVPLPAQESDDDAVSADGVISGVCCIVQVHAPPSRCLGREGHAHRAGVWVCMHVPVRVRARVCVRVRARAAHIRRLLLCR